MPYTFVPKEKHAKAYGENLKISTKNAEKVCSVIRNKTLSRARRLLNDLAEKRRNLRGKYYSNAVNDIREIMNSCEKNAEFLGLENSRLFVHASASMGNMIKRRRRKSAFGSKIKSTNVEIILIERGKESSGRKAELIKVTGKKELEKAVKKAAKKVKEKTKKEEKINQDSASKEAKKAENAAGKAEKIPEVKNKPKETSSKNDDSEDISGKENQKDQKSGGSK